MLSYHEARLELPSAFRSPYLTFSPSVCFQATVFRLIAGQIFPDFKTDGSGDEVPTENIVFVPPHLRAIQIQENPMLLGPADSILDNLLYGIKKNPTTDFVALEARARKIMSRLGLRESLLRKNFKRHGYIGTNGCRLTRGDRQLISLGRAFVMNPEVIVAHKPTLLLDDEHSDLVLDMFREFVDRRGILMDPNEPLIMRRKRTVVYTAKNERAALGSHQIFDAVDGHMILRKVAPAIAAGARRLSLAAVSTTSSTSTRQEGAETPKKKPSLFRAGRRSASNSNKGPAVEL